MNSSAPKKEPSTTMIYVSNLPFTTRDEQLRELFKDFEIKTAYVALRRNGRSKGFGFVNLAKESDQQKAIEKVDGKEFDGRKLTAKIAFNDERRNDRGELKEQFKKQLPQKQEGSPSETVVYVSNLPWSYKDEDLKKIFTDLNVKSSTVAFRRNGRSKGFGFVEFESKEDQQKALAFDQKKIDDRVVTVKVSLNYRGSNNQGNRRQYSPNTSGGRNFDSRSRGRSRFGGRGIPSRRRNNSQGGNLRPANVQRTTVITKAPLRNTNRAENTLYVSNLPFDLDDNDLRQIFSEFNVKNANVAMRQSGRSLGFGFVEFHNAQDTKNALEALDQSEVNNRVITVKVATGRNTGGGARRTIIRRTISTRRRNPSNNENREPSSSMIYVSNLPFSVDDKGLSQIFTGYKVNKAYVALRRNGRSKGFGFVDFSSNEDQQKALKLNGHEVEGRPLTIQIANKVEAKQQGATNTK